jgi:2-haloalkanoic acid dehalogenase type II
MNDVKLLRKMKTSRGPVRAVLFDFGGTLANIDNSEIPRVMKRVLEECGINRSFEDVFRAWVKSWEKANFKDLAKLLDRFWVRWNEQILRNLRVSSNTTKLSGFITTHWWDYSRVTLYPDAEKILPQLKEKGLKVGLVTSGLKSDINKMLSSVGLQDYFDVVVTTDTLRKMKPDVEVFRYALERLKTKASEAVFVGDEIETDYKGAQESGLAAFLIDRDDKFQDKSLNRIPSLENLPLLIST